MTEREFHDLFGDEIPMEAVELVFGKGNEDMPMLEVRERLRAIAAKQARSPSGEEAVAWAFEHAPGHYTIGPDSERKLVWAPKVSLYPPPMGDEPHSDRYRNVTPLCASVPLQGVVEALRKALQALDHIDRRAHEIGLVGTSTWDQLAGFSDIHDAREHARIALSAKAQAGGEEKLDHEQVPGWPPLKKALWDVVVGENLNDGHYINAYDLTAKLFAAAAPQAGETVAGNMVTVPKSALDWLFGEGPAHDGKHFGDDVDGDVAFRRPYWWRSHFRKLIYGEQPRYDKARRTIASAPSSSQPQTNWTGAEEADCAHTMTRMSGEIAICCDCGEELPISKGSAT